MPAPLPAWMNPTPCPDQQPLPWRQRSLAEVGITGKQAAALVAAGYSKLGVLYDALENNTLPKIAGVGPGSLEKIRAGIIAWRDGL